MEAKRTLDALRKIAEPARFETVLLTAFFGHDETYDLALEYLTNPTVAPTPSEKQMADAAAYLKSENKFTRHLKASDLYDICVRYLGLDKDNFISVGPKATKYPAAMIFPIIISALTADNNLIQALMSADEDKINNLKTAFPLGGTPKPGKEDPDLTLFALLSCNLEFFKRFVEQARKNPKLKDLLNLNACYTEHGINLLHLAARLPIPGLMSYLVEQGVAYDCRTIPTSAQPTPFTPLQLVLPSAGATKEFLMALRAKDENHLRNVVNNVCNEPSTSGIKPLDLLSYYLINSRVNPGDKPLFDQASFLKHVQTCVEICGECFEFTPGLEALINDTPELEADKKTLVLKLLKTKDDTLLQELSAINKKRRTLPTTVPAPDVASTSRDIIDHEPKKPAKTVPAPDIASTSRDIIDHEPKIPAKTAPAPDVASTSRDIIDHEPKKPVKTAPAPEVVSTSRDIIDLKPKKLAKKAPAPDVASTSRDIIDHEPKVPGKPTANVGGGLEEEELLEIEASLDDALSPNRPKSVLDQASAQLARAKEEEEKSQKEQNTLQWKLMLAATALLKSPTGASTDEEKVKWASTFKFLVDHDRSRALGLLRRLLEIAKEEPKPQITIDHLFILAGNPLELVPEKKITITQGKDVRKITIVKTYPSVTPLKPEQPKHNELRQLQITSNSGRERLILAYEYSEKPDAVDKTVSFIPVTTVAEHLSDPEILKELLADSKDGRTLFHWAMISGSLDIFKCLLEKGVSNLSKHYPFLEASIPSLNEPDSLGNTVVHEAALTGSYAIQSEQRDGQIRSFYGVDYALPLECPTGITDSSVQLYSLLDKHQVNFNARNQSNEVGLHCAELSGQMSFLDCLAGRPDAPLLDMEGNGQGISLLHVSAIRSKSLTQLRHIATKFRNKGLTPEAPDAQGYTALHWAAAVVNLDAQLILRSLGADEHAKNNPTRPDADTPLSIALVARADRNYDRSSKSLWLKMCPRINGIVTLFQRDGVYLSRFERVLGQKSLLSLTHLLFDQALTEHNARIAEQNRRIATENQVVLRKEYVGYLQHLDKANGLVENDGELDEKQFHNANHVQISALMKPLLPLLSLEEFKDLCLNEGCAVLRLTREQYRNLLSACFPADNPCDKYIERGIREYVLAPVALYVLSGVKPAPSAMEEASVPAQKKLKSIQRRREFVISGPTPASLGRNHDSLRLLYLDAGDNGKTLVAIRPSREKAIEAFRTMMREYIAVGDPWVMTTEVISGVAKPVPATDADGKRIPAGRRLRFFLNPTRHIDAYGPIAEKCLIAIEEFEKKHRRPLEKADLLQIIETAYAEALEVFLYNPDITSTDTKGSDIFDSLLTALTMTHKVPAPVMRHQPVPVVHEEEPPLPMMGADDKGKDEEARSGAGSYFKM